VRPGLPMPHQFKVTITEQRTGQSDQVSGEFPDEEWQPLEKFLECSYRLAKCRIAETQKDLKLHISGKVGEPTVFTAQLPPEDDIAVFLHRMRPFILDEEPTSFLKVRNILKRRLALPAARKYLDHLKDLYSGKDFPMTIEVGTESGTLSLTSDEAIRKWLNASEYHQDSDKQAELQAMYRIFPKESAQVLFLSALLGRAAAIGRMGALIDNLAKREGIQQSMRA
jgi:hypothetical protein